MKKEHAVFLLVAIVCGASVATIMGKLDASAFKSILALVLAYLAPSPVIADISKEDQ